MSDGIGKWHELLVLRNLKLSLGIQDQLSCVCDLHESCLVRDLHESCLVREFNRNVCVSKLEGWIASRNQTI